MGSFDASLPDRSRPLKRRCDFSRYNHLSLSHLVYLFESGFRRHTRTWQGRIVRTPRRASNTIGRIGDSTKTKAEETERLPDCQELRNVSHECRRKKEEEAMASSPSTTRRGAQLAFSRLVRYALLAALIPAMATFIFFSPFGGDSLNGRAGEVRRDSDRALATSSLRHVKEENHGEMNDVVTSSTVRSSPSKEENTNDVKDERSQSEDDVKDELIRKEDRMVSPASAKTKMVIAICSCTRSKPSWTSLTDIALQKLLIPSIERTVTAREREVFDIRLYLGMEHDDAFWLNHQESFVVPDWLTIDRGFYKSREQDSLFRDVTKHAYDEGAEYIVRVNDDTEFASEGWITQGVQTLRGFEPTNLGVVRPTTVFRHVVFSTFKATSPGLRSQVEENTRSNFDGLDRVYTIWFDDDDVEQNVHGVPVLRAMYQKAFARFPNADTYTYVNGDLLVDNGFVQTADAVASWSLNGHISRRFLVVGRRTNVDWKDKGVFDMDKFDEHFAEGKMFMVLAIDFFMVSKSTFNWAKEIPPFVVGRPAYDNWLVDHAYHDKNVALIDATQTIRVIHQTDSEGNSAWGGPNLSKEDKMYNRVLGKRRWDHGSTNHAEYVTFRKKDGAIGMKLRKGGRETRESELLHEMVHRTHLDVFNDFYPPSLSARSSDDWIAQVYQPGRSVQLKAWEVSHHTAKHGTRFTVDDVEMSNVVREVKRGKEMIAKWVDDTANVVVQDVKKGKEMIATRASDAAITWTVCVTVSNGFKDMFHNWLYWFTALKSEGMRLVVIAEDDVTFEALHKSTYWITMKSAFDVDLSTDAHSYNSATYKKMVSRRPRHVLRVLAEYPNVIYSDIDTVWLGDPRSYLRGDFDMWGGLDAMRGTRAYYCTGFLAFKSTDRSIGFLEQWRDTLDAKPQLNQPIFNELLRKSDVRHSPLSRIQFPSGDLYFKKKKRKSVVVVHANYMIGKKTKVKALKSVGLWRGEDEIDFSGVTEISVSQDSLSESSFDCEGRIQAAHRKDKLRFDRDESAQLVEELLRNGCQTLICRTGTGETGTSQGMSNTGFYDKKTPENIKRFRDMHYSGIQASNMMALFNWKHWPKQLEIFKTHCPTCAGVSSDILYPHCLTGGYPWAKALQGKTVLVVTPWTLSVETNYVNRELIWSTGHYPAKDCLPTFKELKTVTTRLPQKTNKVSWFEEVEILKQKIDAVGHFDVALLGCGAYGMAVFPHIRSLSFRPSAIYVGGALQLWFGVQGERWHREGYKQWKKFYNEHWTWPRPEEMQNSEWTNVENSAYVHKG